MASNNRTAARQDDALSFDRNSFECVTTKRAFDGWLDRCEAAKSVCFDTETTGLDHRTCDLVGFAFGIREGNRIDACYVPVGHQQHLGKQLTVDQTLPRIRRLLKSGKPIIGANLLFDMLVLKQERYAADIANVHDTQRMSYALTGNQHLYHGMDALAERMFGYKPISFKEVVDGKIVPDFSHVRLDVATAYSAEDAAVTLMCAVVLAQQLKAAGMWDVYDKIDRPLIPVLADMKWTGVKIDTKLLERLHAEWGPRLEKLEKKIVKLSGRPDFNPRSPYQVASLLYGPKEEGGLGLVASEYTDSGNESVDKNALAEHTGIPIVDALLEYKGLAKLVGDYVVGLPKRVHSTSGRVHTDLKDTITKTRRFSSAGPNLQNIPVRTDEGAMLREAFITEKKHVLISLDYSQIEYRILAHVTGDPTLLDAYRSGKDLHAAMAAAVKGGEWEAYANKADKVRYAIRTTFKNVNFATIYGAGPKKIAAMSKIDVPEAYSLLSAHEEMCPRVYEWKDETWEFAKKFGYVQDLFGGRTWLKYINSRDAELRGGAERLAINAPIQGGAAELIRLAMPFVDTMCDLDGARLLLQVHDELVVEAPAKRAEIVAKSCKHAMEHAADEWIDWQVPIVAEYGIGKNWREAK